MAAKREGNTIRIEDNDVGFDAQKKFYRATDQKEWDCQLWHCAAE